MKLGSFPPVIQSDTLLSTSHLLRAKSTQTLRPCLKGMFLRTKTCKKNRG